MKSKILSIMNATKKRGGVAILCGTVVAAISAGTVFAANSTNPFKLKMENGVTSSSTDGGKAWSKVAPNEAMIGEKIKGGKIVIQNEAGGMKDIQFKDENGVRSYSTDGGKTWSEKAPEGVKIDNDGKISMINDIEAKDGDKKGLLVKEVNGVRSYSTDDGKTWSEKVPDGVTIGQDGKISMINGIPSKDGEGKGMLSKMENGVRSYSTDGGKTWSEKAPAGAEDSVTIGN